MSEKVYVFGNEEKNETGNETIIQQKKFLDAEGVKYLWSKINMQDYPNNETLMDVIEAIDETKADKSELFSGSWNDLEDKPTTTKYQDELLISRTDVENEYYFNLPDKFHLSGEHTYKAYLKNRYNYGYITISGYESTNMLSMDLIFKNFSNNILFTAHGNSLGKIYFTDLSDFNNETLIIYSGEELMDHIIPDTIARVSDIPIIQIITWEADD